MKEQLHLKNHLKEVRMAANLSEAQLAEMVGVSRNRAIQPNSKVSSYPLHCLR